MESNIYTEQSQSVPKLRFPEFDGVWVEKRTKEIAPLQRGFDLPTTDVVVGDYPVVYSNGILRKHNKYKVEAPGIVTGRSGTIGKVTYVEEDFWPHNTTLWVTDFYNNNPKFIFYFYLRFNLNRYNAGSTVPTLNRNDVHFVKKRIPTPPEQTRIATFLTAIDKRINLLQKKKAQLEQYKKGIMQKLFSVMADGRPSLRFKDDNGNDFPDWEEKKLGEVASFRRGSFPQPYGLPKWYDDANGTPFVQVYDVDKNFKLKTKTKQKISELAKPKSVFVKKGSIVLTIQGSIGRIAITQYDSYVDRTLLIFQSFNTPLDKLFFTYVVYLLFAKEKQIAVGGTIKTITKEKLSAFVINVPCIEEQQKIANFLSSIDSSIEIIGNQIDASIEFKQGLLQKMFV